jgi:hypothetical protein
LGWNLALDFELAVLDMGAPRLGLCDDVGKNTASDQGDLVLQHKLAFLQPLQLQLVERFVLGKSFDDIVQITVFALQYVKAGVKLLLFLDFGVAHRSCFPLWRTTLKMIRLDLWLSQSCPSRRRLIKLLDRR